MHLFNPASVTPARLKTQGGAGTENQEPQGCLRTGAAKAPNPNSCKRTNSCMPRSVTLLDTSHDAGRQVDMLLAMQLAD